MPTICFPEPNQIEQEINAVLAEKAYPNVSVLRKKRISITNLETALMGCRVAEIPLTYENGTIGAFEVIQNFLVGSNSTVKL